MDDSYIHIVKRTDQWNERAVQSYVVPRGVLCVELTPDGNTRIKVGEGNKYYSQLPYIGLNIDISQYFTKEEVKKLVQDTSEETVIAYMDKQPYVRVLGPILPSAASLPKSGNKDGDIRFVQLAKVTADGKAYIEYVWFNNRWDPLSTALDIDVSKFATKEDLAAVQKSVTELAKRVTLVEQVKHTHPNKGILDAITAAFTTEQAAKLAGIEPNANKYVLPIASRRSLGGIIIGEGLLIDATGKVTVDTSGIIVPPYDDTEVKRRITNLENVAHTHINKSILDATTASYTSVEKSKLAGLENYDDTALSGRVTTLEESSHTHVNKSVLDNTTASYTTEEQTKLAGLENYTLPTASANTLGGIKVGNNLSIDANGVLSATGGSEYIAGEGIRIGPNDTYYVLDYMRSNQAGMIATGLHATFRNPEISIKFNYPENIVSAARYQPIFWALNSQLQYADGSYFYGVISLNSVGYKLSIGGWPTASGGGWFSYDSSYTNGNVTDNSAEWYQNGWSSSYIGTSTQSGFQPTDDEICLFRYTTDVILYYLKIYDNDVLIGDLVPVENAVTGEIGLYDRVREVFLGKSTGSGTFIGGSRTGELIGDASIDCITNTGVLNVTKNASGNLVVSKVTGNSTIILPEEHSDFTGTDGTTAGTHGLVPAPETTDVDKYLASDGTWKSVSQYSLPTASSSTLGGVKIGSNISIDANGVISTHAPYSLPIASSNDLGGVKIGTGLSIDANGVLSTTGGGGSGNIVDGVATSVSSANVDIDMYTGIQWDQGTITENGNISRNDRIRTRNYYSITIPSNGKITLMAHDTNDTGLTWNIMLYNSNQGLLLDSPWMPYGSELNILEYLGRASLARYVLRYASDNTPISPSDLKDAVLRTTDTAIDVNYGDGLTVNTDNELEVVPATSSTIGGIIVGSNLSIDANGVLSATGGGTEYVAGDGISIDEGSSTTEITSLAWEQGSISHVNGEDDDLTTTVIRSPFIDAGLTQMVNVSAQDDDGNDMVWESAFYDSNHEFISMTSTWQTISGDDTRPANAKYVRFVLRKANETLIDENSLTYCEISWPIEIGNYVITNTGVTHAEMDGASIIVVEDGETKELVNFGDAFTVQNGSVNINTANRIILNVENLQ
ncbi:MAG: hypothetical protein J5614_09570 [Paludibacteraceae bacterium]|nr:hypothetical protein [Paludibacteraceae bacterium]